MKKNDKDIFNFKPGNQSGVRFHTPNVGSLDVFHSEENKFVILFTKDQLEVKIDEYVEACNPENGIEISREFAENMIVAFAAINWIRDFHKIEFLPSGMGALFSGRDNNYGIIKSPEGHAVLLLKGDSNE